MTMLPCSCRRSCRRRQPPRRQVFDIGPVEAGDRIEISLMTTPGYGETYAFDGFSLLMLDDQQSLYAWYQDGLTLFTRNSELIVGHDSSQFFIVLDNNGADMVPSARVKITRGYTTLAQTRTQKVYLQYAAVNDFAVQNSVPVDLQAFNVSTDKQRGQGDTPGTPDRPVQRL